MARAMVSGVPQKMRGYIQWLVDTWGTWAIHRNQPVQPGEAHFNCSTEALLVQEITFWLSRFVLVVRREDGNCYPPNSLYKLCCGLLRQLNDCGRPEVNMLCCLLLAEIKNHKSLTGRRANEYLMRFLARLLTSFSHLRAKHIISTVSS